MKLLRYVLFLIGLLGRRDGSEARPFHTVQEAMDFLESKEDDEHRVVYVRSQPSAKVEKTSCNGI